MTLVAFSPTRSGNPRIASMVCAECGGEPAIFVVYPDSALSVFCSPACAAGCGVAPWADADLVTRISWSERQLAPMRSAFAPLEADAAGAAGDVSSHLVTAPGPVPVRGHPFW